MNLGKLTIMASISAALLLSSAVAREPQPGDDRGGKGKPFIFAREAQPGDDHRGKGKPFTFAREKEPGDDRGGKGEKQPGDDRGRDKGKPNA